MAYQLPGAQAQANQRFLYSVQCIYHLQLIQEPVQMYILFICFRCAEGAKFKLLYFSRNKPRDYSKE